MVQAQLTEARRHIRALLAKNPYAARWLYRRYLHQETSRYPLAPLLIYQMGKVGSKSIRDSLRAVRLNRRVFHVHFLSPERVALMERERRRYLGAKKQHLLEHVWQYMYINDQLRRGARRDKWKVITLTREPVGRNVSTFFENIDVSEIGGGAYRFQSDYYDFDIDVSPGDISKLSELFFDRVHHDRPLVFFDEELNGTFDVDVYATQFDRARGYQIYETDTADILLIRLENLNECAPEAFARFLGLKDFSLLNTNVGSDKAYAPVYEAMKRSMVFPRAYIDHLYDSKYARHFYSQDEIDRFKNKWQISES